jgi:hypothetical protein
MTNRRRTLSPITHEITKAKQNNITKTIKMTKSSKKKLEEKRGKSPCRIGFAIYRQFGRTRGQLKLVIRQAFD